MWPHGSGTARPPAYRLPHPPRPPGRGRATPQRPPAAAGRHVEAAPRCEAWQGGRLGATRKAVPPQEASGAASVPHENPSPAGGVAAPSTRALFARAVTRRHVAGRAQPAVPELRAGSDRG